MELVQTEAAPIAEIKVLKINNVLYVGRIAPHIKSFVDKVQVPTMTYETLYTHFCNIVQFGENDKELWVAYEGDEPVAFMTFYVRGLPHIGCVHGGFVHSWTKNPEAMRLLWQEFRKFGIRHRAPYYTGDARGLGILRRFKQLASKDGYEIEETGVIGFICRRKQQ